MLNAASHASLWQVGGLKSFSEQKGLKKGKQQVPMLKYIFDKQELQQTLNRTIITISQTTT